jgi:hypothetical protein
MSAIVAVPLSPRPASPASAPTRPNAVVVAHVPPWPAAAGNEYRLARLIAFLEESGHNVHFVYRPFRAEPITEDEARQLAERYPRLYIVEPDQARITFATNVQSAFDVVAALAERNVESHEPDFPGDFNRLQPRVLELTRSFAPDLLIALVGDLARALDATTVIAEYIFMSRALSRVPSKSRRVLDLIDVFSSKHEKVLRYGVDDQFAVSREEEAYLLRRADVAIAIQAEEAEAVRSLVPGMAVVTAGIDYPIVRPRHDPRGDQVLIVGSDNPMNRAGLSAFLRYAWPTVVREMPDAELAVVGSVGTALSGAERGVKVFGRVDDLDEMYANARVAVNPAVAGTGVKVKTLEAIAHLRPIVLWPLGADGLSQEVRSACSVADNWSSFAHLVIGHLQQREPATGRSELVQVIERALSPQVVYSELSDVVLARRSRGLAALLRSAR